MDFGSQTPNEIKEVFYFMPIERIYHPYNLWEDFKNGFYDPHDESKIPLVIEMFSCEYKTRINMEYVIYNWKYSCEHNLTNQSLNRIAWLGQSACCVYAKVPSKTTMQAWNLLDEKTQNTANKIAQETIDKWFQQNKRIQLCLNIY